MTQAQLAEFVSCSSGHIGSVERATTKVSLPTLCKIALALDVSVDELVHFPIENHALVYADYFAELRRIHESVKSHDKKRFQKLSLGILKMLASDK